jgi:hypothetical protein
MRGGFILRTPGLLKISERFWMKFEATSHHFFL